MCSRVMPRRGSSCGMVLLVSGIIDCVLRCRLVDRIASGSSVQQSRSGLATFDLPGGRQPVDDLTLIVEVLNFTEKQYREHRDNRAGNQFYQPGSHKSRQADPVLEAKLTGGHFLDHLCFGSRIGDRGRVENPFLNGIDSTLSCRSSLGFDLPRHVAVRLITKPKR